ncbi:MAG TPA: response regulator [Solirubrobacterales bacterium]|nr:response regulator [Solirubrobacterales bacterium]
MADEPKTKPLVLVVEDDERLLGLRARSLEQRGLKVVASNTVDEALSTLKSRPELDAVLLDIRLSTEEPGDKSGIALGKMIRERYRDVPIIAYSAFFDDEIRDEVLPVFDRYYSKGSRPVAELEEALEEIRKLAFEAHRRRER